jgi:hypothetical protein
MESISRSHMLTSERITWIGEEAMTRRASGNENRRAPRLSGAFLMRVRGVDVEGQAFDTTSLADNICADGLYFQLPRTQAKGAQLFAVVRLTGGLTIAARGHVLRKESRDYGLSGIAVRFTKARVLSARERL